jgi:hypothetical protein
MRSRAVAGGPRPHEHEHANVTRKADEVGLTEVVHKGKVTVPGTKPMPRWCPSGLTKTQRWRIQKVWAREFTEEKREAKRDD